MYCDMRFCGMVVSIRVKLVACEIMVMDWGTSEHGE